MRTLVLGFALLATLALATAATASSSDSSPGAVYTLTNSPAGNAVAVFSRAANITSFTVGKDSITAIAGSTRPLGAGSSGPAEVAFSPDGGTLVVAEKTSSTIDTYVVGADGIAGVPTVSASVGATPFGFNFDNRGHLLVSNASGSASSYAITPGGASVI